MQELDGLAAAAGRRSGVHRTGIGSHAVGEPGARRCALRPVQNTFCSEVEVWAAAGHHPAAAAENHLVEFERFLELSQTLLIVRLAIDGEVSQHMSAGAQQRDYVQHQITGRPGPSHTASGCRSGGYAADLKAGRAPR